jgi:hypothetical protein
MSSEEQILTVVPLSEEAEGADDLAPEPGARPKHVRWEGSNVRPIEIDWLYKTKCVPLKLHVDSLRAN